MILNEGHGFHTHKEFYELLQGRVKKILLTAVIWIQKIQQLRF